MGDACADYVGDFYDPTHQCPPFSGSAYCWGTDYLCNDTDYEYDCDFDNNRYSCAPGDLSGKLGTIEDSSDFYVESNDTNMLFPRTDDMIGKMFAIYCGDNTVGITYLACAPFYNATSEPEPAQNTTSVATFGGSNKINGTVTVDNGHVIVDLHVSEDADLPKNYSYCTSGGMKYHIHTEWFYDDDTDRIGSSACGATYTGGHYDPWHGMSVEVY